MELLRRPLSEYLIHRFGVTVQNAQILAQAHRLAATFQAALTGRAVIDQAIGILMSRSGVTPEQANARIRQLGEQANTTMSVVAAGILREAVRRARARHPEEI